MALSCLPPELLEPIIQYTIPEGFEGLALSCKGIFALCSPLLADYNRLRSKYRKFRYRFDDSDSRFGNGSAYHLIARVALCPEVARYIRYADFRDDSTRTVAPIWTADSAAVAHLLRSSEALKEAGIDPKEFQAKVETDVKAHRYSQHAAVFLLAILPNVEEIELPRGWDPLCDEAHKLLATASGYGSLSQVRKVEVVAGLSASGDPYPWDRMMPLLCLPQIECFYGHGCVPARHGTNSVTARSPSLCFGRSLKILQLATAQLDGKSIVQLLRLLSNLREFGYWHDPESVVDWDVCEFLTAIEDEVGGQLERMEVWWKQDQDV